MGKFKLKFKLTGLELEIEGSRDDVPLVAEHLGRQFAGIMQPVANAVDPDLQGEPVVTVPPPAGMLADGATARRRGKRRPASRGAGATAAPHAADAEIAWDHDAARWGQPRQAWSLPQKCLWLLYVVSHEAARGELTAGEIARAFNDRFKAAGALRPSNVSRDLTRARKDSRQPLFAEDGRTTPPRWYLTQRGQEEAAHLVVEARGAGGAAEAPPAADPDQADLGV